MPSFGQQVITINAGFSEQEVTVAGFSKMVMISAGFHKQAMMGA